MEGSAGFQSRDAARDHEISERVVIDAGALKRSVLFAQKTRKKLSKFARAEEYEHVQRIDVTSPCAQCKSGRGIRHDNAAISTLFAQAIELQHILI